MTKPGDAGGIQSASPTCPKLAHHRPKVGPKYEHEASANRVPSAVSVTRATCSHDVVTMLCRSVECARCCDNLVRTARWQCEWPVGYHQRRVGVNTPFKFWAYPGPTMGKFWASRASRLYPACISRLRHFSQLGNVRYILLLRTDSPVLAVQTVE